MMSSSCESISPFNNHTEESNSGTTSGSSTTSSPTPVISVPDIASPSPIPEEDMSDQRGESAEVQNGGEAEAVQPPPAPHPEVRRVRALKKPVAPTRAQ